MCNGTVTIRCMRHRDLESLGDFVTKKMASELAGFARHALRADQLVWQNGQLQQRIEDQDEKIRTLEAQNRVLREIAYRPPPPPVILDNTESLRIMVEGMHRIISPPVVINEEHAHAGAEGGQDVPMPTFWPDVEFDPNMMPTRGGWVNDPLPTNGNVASTTPHFRAGDGNTVPPHAGGIIE